MTKNSDLLPSILGLLSGLGELRLRKMFGGTYIYCDNLFIATVHDDMLYFKANADTAQDFIERGLKPFSYPSTMGTVTLQYYQAPDEVFNDSATMKHWAKKALVVARQDAAGKKPRKTRVNS